MTNQVLNISDYTISADEMFFFDNNIWMLLESPFPDENKNKVAKYTKFFKYVLERNRPIYVLPLVLSEFANALLRKDMKIAISKGEVYNNFKKNYITSARGLKMIEAVNKSIKNITSFCEKTSDDFNYLNLEDILELFIKIGFNDSYYAHLAAKKKWIIVSDDSDFTSNTIPNIGLKILTARHL